MTNWWHKATRDERLRQIDAGIELGMTGTQIALAVGVPAQTIRDFGNYNGRSFPGNAFGRRHTKNQMTGLMRKKWAADYYRGEKVGHADNADLTEIFGGAA